MNLLQKHRSYVAFFDLVGFKSAIDADVEEACAALEALRVSVLEIENTLIVPSSTRIPILPAHYVSYKFFSDSFMLYTKCDQNEDLVSIVFVSTHLLMKYFLWRLPMRGGLAYGDFFINEKYDIFCGKPLVKAYELGENSQWFGLILDDQVAHNYIACPLVRQNERDSIIIKWDVLFKKCGIQKVWVANWAPRMEYKVKPPLTGEQLYEVFKMLFRKDYNLYDDNTRSKYERTAHFINYTLVNS